MQAGEWIALDHLDRMTDSTGLIQHAYYGVPRRESGYTTDDNARALRLATRLWSQQPDERMLCRVVTYLGFLEFARCPSGEFHNFMSYQRQWLDAEGTGDCQGQVVRSLAEVVGSGLDDDLGALARELMESLLPRLADLRGIRAQAYVVLACGRLWRAAATDIEALENAAWCAAERLVECYQRNRRPDWSWFESRMTYANAVLPHALFVAAERWPKEPFLEVALESFDFHDRASTAGGVFSPVGSDGWYAHGEDKALYDQQPLEADTMADAALAAFGLLGEEKYLTTFRRAHAWFHGENSLKLPLVDVLRGACYDGLQPTGVNRNQGAESTLAHLGAELNHLQIERSLRDGQALAAASA
jgi:hypothetical protein